MKRAGLHAYRECAAFPSGMMGNSLQARDVRQAAEGIGKKYIGKDLIRD